MSRSLAVRISGFVVLSALVVGCIVVAPQPAFAKDKKKSQAIDPALLEWPPAPQVARIKFIAAYTGDDIKPKQKQGLLERLAGVPEVTSKAQMLKPYGVAVDSKGKAYVTDTAQHIVYVYDFEKKDVSYRGDKPPAGFKTPTGVAVDGSDRLFVTDSGNHNVTAFDPDGKVLDIFGEDELQKPAGAAVDDTLGRLYVADVKQRQIAVFDLKTFKFDHWMGTRAEAGKDKGEDVPGLIAPGNIAVHPDGLIYISDAYGARVVVLDPDGNQVRTIGELGEGPGHFGRPRGVAFDSDGHLYVVDAMAHCFQMLTDEGTALMPLGQMGRFPGQFSVPAGIAVDRFNRIIVVDQQNGRIQVFRYVTDAEAATEQAKKPVKNDKQVAQAQKKK